MPPASSATKAKVEFIDGLLNRSHAKSAMDFFCGDGNLTRPLAFLGHQVCGYDSDYGAITLARAKARRLSPADRPRLECHDLLNKPLRNQFDVGFWLDSPIKLLTDATSAALYANFLGSIRLGGLAIIDLQSAAWTRAQRPVSDDHVSGRPELEAILKRHGFAVVSVYGSFQGDKPSPLLQREITVARRLSTASPQQNI